MTDAEQVELPASAVASLMGILEAMVELTTVQAADRGVGKHRRLRREDVIAYKAAIDDERERVLDTLVHLAQTERMGYDG